MHCVILCHFQGDEFSGSSRVACELSTPSGHSLGQHKRTAYSVYLKTSGSQRLPQQLLGGRRNCTAKLKNLKFTTEVSPAANKANFYFIVFLKSYMAGPGFSWITYLQSKVRNRLHDETCSTMTTLQLAKVTVKVKLSLKQAMKAQGGSSSSVLSLTSALEGVGDQRHAMPPGKESRYPLYNATVHTKIAKCSSCPRNTLKTVPIINRTTMHFTQKYI